MVVKNKKLNPKNKKYIYLDHASATLPSKKTISIMAQYEEMYFANPSSIHQGGNGARALLEESRAKIAELIFAHKDEIIFTGSGSESNALAILGVVRAYRGKGIPHIVTTAIEHPSVLENCALLEKNMEAEVTYINPDKNGHIDPKDIRQAIKNNTVLVSVMYANNEIGTIEQITQIAKAVRNFRKNNKTIMPIPGMDLPYFHTDACQAMNYLETSNIEKLGVDLMTWNSSKIYGPKGVGLLYKKRFVKLEPLYKGGGQEFGLRPGTHNVASIAGAAFALTEVNQIKVKETKRLVALRDYCIKKLLAIGTITGYEIVLNGDPINRLPNNINISVPGISSELIVIELDAKGFAVSAKSACKSDEPDLSYVITAIREAEGKTANITDGSLRISMGRSTTLRDMNAFLFAFKTILLKYKTWK